MARRKNLSLSASVISPFRGKYFEIEFKFICVIHYDWFKKF